jgi:hypothetical protein
MMTIKMMTVPRAITITMMLSTMARATMKSGGAWADHSHHQQHDVSRKRMVDKTATTTTTTRAQRSSSGTPQTPTTKAAAVSAERLISGTSGASATITKEASTPHAVVLAFL